jgi:ribosome silencing factor RsfS/YbeB/iojap
MLVLRGIAAGVSRTPMGWLPRDLMPLAALARTRAASKEAPAAAAGGAKTAPLPGAHFNKATGKWTSRIRVNGETTHLGTFATAEEASSAYLYAKQFAELEAAGAAAPEPQTPVEGFVGVFRDRDSGQFEALVTLPGGKETVTGGEYGTAEEAARAYDALARLYHGPEVKTNFPPAADYGGWVRADAVEPRRQIPVIPGVLPTVEEVLAALRAENAIDPVSISLGDKRTGAAALAAYLVVCTGKSTSHMRRIADMLVRSLRARDVRPPEEVGEWAVENREGDDWMIVDMGDVVVNVMDPVARRTFALEERYRDGGRREAEELEAIQDADELVRRYPVPDEWIARTEQDDTIAREALAAVEGEEAQQQQQQHRDDHDQAHHAPKGKSRVREEKKGARHAKGKMGERKSRGPGPRSAPGRS